MNRRFVLAALLATGAFAVNPGVRPRPELSDYPAHRSGPKITIAAEVLSADQVSNSFATDLNKAWIVVEVAVYPEKDAVAVAPSDFVLRVGKDEQRTLVRAATPRAIAASLHRKSTPQQRDSDVTVYPSVGIGYESGPGYYDPATGQRRGGGVRTSVGVGVGVGGGPAALPPASTSADRHTMEQELAEKSLPDGATAKPVAGYLYFPRPAAKSKDATLELSYNGDAGTLTLELPPPKRAKK